MMAVKSIIDIDVNDDKFKKFNEAFDEYQKALEGTQEKWKKLGSISDNLRNNSSRTNLDSLNNSTDKAIGKTSELLKNFTKANTTIKEMTTSLSGLAKGFSAGSISGISGIAGALTGIVSIAGAAALAGVGAMSYIGNNAVNSQRSGRQLGLTPGQMRAFNTDLTRYTDESMLHNIVQQKYDPAGRVFLSMASGMNESEMTNANAIDISERIMMKARKWWQTTAPEARTSAAASAMGFTQLGITPEQIMGWSNTANGEIPAAFERARSDAKRLDISDENVNKFYDMNRNIELAGKTIETVLIDKLGSAATVVDKFTAAVSGVIGGDYSTSPHAGINDVAPSGNKRLSGQEMSGRIRRFNQRPSVDYMKQNNAMIERKYGLPAGMLSAMEMQESSMGANPAAFRENSAGAMGFFGWQSASAKMYGLDPSDRGNYDLEADASGRYMRDLLRKFSKRDKLSMDDPQVITKALNAYNGYTRGGQNPYSTVIMQEIQRQGNSVVVTDKAGTNTAVQINGSAPR